MKALDREKLDVVNQTQSNPALRDWRGQFTPEVKPLEFERFGNYGEFVTAKGEPRDGWILKPSNSMGLKSGPLKP